MRLLSFVLVLVLRYIFVSYTFLSLHVMTEAEMSAPYDPRGCFLPGGAVQFSVCALCGHSDIDWVNKAAIDAHNAKDKVRYKAEVVKYNQVVTTMKKRDKSLKRPVYNQKPLMIRCNCTKKYFALVQ